MAHHGSEIPEELLKSLKEEGIGATGKFPEGKLNPTDEGEIRFAVAIENNKIVLHFGKPVAWLGCTKEQAMDIAKAIIEKAQIL